MATKKPDQFSYAATNKPFMNELAAASEAVEMEGKSKAPDFLQGVVSQEKFDNSPKCQFIAKKVEEDPSLLETKTYTEAFVPGRRFGFGYGMVGTNEGILVLVCGINVNLGFKS